MRKYICLNKYIHPKTRQSRLENGHQEMDGMADSAAINHSMMDKM